MTAPHGGNFLETIALAAVMSGHHTEARTAIRGLLDNELGALDAAVDTLSDLIADERRNRRRDQ